jgi:uncharacterized membrane protein (UPF0127 family)
VSARKRITLLSIGGIILVATATISLVSFLRQVQDVPSTVTMKIDSKSYTLGVAATPAVQHLGLGNRIWLPENKGMLFEFGKPAVQCFWMKDMHFPLDMIWVSSGKRVEYLQTSVSPDSYPHTYCPNVQAKYVIELNAGEVNKTSIYTGETLHF